MFDVAAVLDPPLVYVLVVLYCAKNVHIRSYSGLHFPAFGLNTERYGVSLSVFSPNARNCGPEQLRIRTLFTQY